MEQEQSQHREFVSQRLETLQAQIEDGENQIVELEGRLALENSARGIQDIQNQIETLQGKIATWQSNYAGMLDFYKGSRTNYLSVVEPAAVPTTPVSPNVKYYLLLAAAIGFSLAAGAAFLLDYLDDTIKTKEDVDRILKLPTLGSVSRIPRVREPSDHLVALQAGEGYSPVAEAYRTLRTNLQFSTLEDPSPRLLVSSAAPGEGKTTTACNLGISMAFTGKKVILVDADLRRPSVHKLFGVPNRAGLTSLLLDDSLSVEEILVDTPVMDLKLLTSGPLPPNPGDLLGSDLMGHRLDQIKELADVIIFDSPPVLAVSDASILGGICTGVILVVDAGRTRSQVVRRAKETLDQLDLKVLGIVLNNLKPRRMGQQYYYSNYYSYAADPRGRERRRRSKTSSAPKKGFLRRLPGPFSGRLSENGRSGQSHPVEEDQEKV